MRAWAVVSSSLDFSTNADAKRDKLRRLVELVGDHPGLPVWESCDEPAWGRKSAEGLYDGYCFLRGLDQQHAIWTNHAPRSTIEELAFYNRATDIAGADIYPVPAPATHSNLPNKTISVVGDETEKNIRAVNGEKPVFMVLQGVGWGELRAPDPGNPPVMPTFHQSRFMAYDAIVHGANGILYWGTASTRKPSQFWSELRSLVSELSALQDVLAAETVQADGASIQRGDGVRMLHKRVDGFSYLILVNDNPDAVGVTVAVPPMQAERLRWLYEQRDVAMENGTLSIELDGHGVAVLTDNLQFRDERRDYSDEWQNAPVTAEADLTEPGNAIRNAGFESDANLDGVPDEWEDLRLPLTASMSTDARSGEYAFRLEGVGGDGAPLAVQRPVELIGGERYRLSSWGKTDPSGVEFRFYTEWATGGQFHPNCLPWTAGTEQWTEYSLEFDAIPDPAGRAYVVQVRGTGAVLFDDLKLEPVR